MSCEVVWIVLVHSDESGRWGDGKAGGVVPVRVSELSRRVHEATTQPVQTGLSG